MDQENENNNTDPQKGMFGVPENYFENSEARIRNALSCLEELREFPLLAKNKDRSGFVVPQGYFGKQTDLELYPRLSGAGKDLFMVVPENYFLTNQERILKLLGSPGAETTRVTFGKDNPFSVEDDYFALNASGIRKRLLSKDTKVIPLYRKKTVLSAAAVLILSLGIGIYQVYHRTEQINECATIACIEKKILFKTKTLESMENDELYELVSPDELMQKLEKKSEQGKPTDDSNNAFSQEYYDEI